MKKLIAILLVLTSCMFLSSCESLVELLEAPLETEETVVSEEEDDKKEKKSDKEDNSEEESEESDEETDKDDKKKADKKPVKKGNFGVEKTSASLAEDDTEHGYEMSFDDSGKASITFKSKEISSVRLQIFDKDGQETWDDYAYADSTSKQISFKGTVELTSGEYTFFVKEHSGYGEYELEVTFKSTGESFAEGQNGSNNVFDQASKTDVDTEYTGQIAINDDIDIYTFTMAEAGNIEMSYKATDIESSKLNLYDADGQEIWDDHVYWNSTSKQIAYKENIALTAGDYYFTVSRHNGYGAYTFINKYVSASESFGEEQNGSDNTFDKANKISMNTEYTGQIAINDTIDTYCFESSGGFNLSCKSTGIESLKLTIYDADGQEIWDDYVYWNSTSKQISYEEKVDLSAGSHYLTVTRHNGYGAYSIALNS